MKDDETANFSSADDYEVAWKLKAERPALNEHESEWTVRSSLQVLGGFMLIFNSYIEFVC